jgi:hypothetical protein
MLWTLAASALTAMAVFAWRAPGTPLRHLGIGVLLAIAANPYVFFYDGLILAVPATVWWTEREHWNRGPWLAAGGLLAVIWCGEHSLYTWTALSASVGGPDWRPPLSLVGPAAAIWLVLAARQAWHSRTVRPDAVEGSAHSGHMQHAG